MSKEAKKILYKDLMSDSNPAAGFLRIIAPILSPGTALDTMNRRAVEVISESTDAFKVQNPQSRQTIEDSGSKEMGVRGTTISFQAWVHHVMLMATTEAIYGPGNPYRDRAVEEAWESVLPRLSAENQPWS